jgi:AraC-like DNA-binding protein
MSTIAEIARLIEKHTGADGIFATDVPRLNLIRSSEPTVPTHVLYEPAICIVAQGRKQTILGADVYLYDATQYLTVSVDLPVLGHVVEASKEKPYLCLRIDLDPALLSAIMLETVQENLGNQLPERGMSLSPMSEELLENALRLLRLIEETKHIAVLAPLIEREFLYRLLIGEQSARLRQIALSESRAQQVNKAIGLIKRNFRKRLRIEQVASEANMSPSSFHQHFKAVTSMSPLQYQKQLRLQEARRLILSQSLDAATAGHAVGYDSPSQFSREYARLFGQPPLRDIARLKDMPQYLFEA